jgi:hypothetical protein
LFEAISILNFGTVVSEYNPSKPITVKSPVVLTLSKFAYCGDDSRNFKGVGVLNFKSYS